MSKELKLKAWDKVKEEMCDVMGIDFIQNMVLCFPITKKTARAGKWRSLEEFELMEFTGLIDKTGVEIYEGYIVSIQTFDWDNWDEENELPMKKLRQDIVTLDRFRFWLKNESFGYEGEDLINPKNCIVIGNIYENPESGAGQCEPSK